MWKKLILKISLTLKTWYIFEKENGKIVKKTDVPLCVCMCYVVDLTARWAMQIPWKCINHEKGIMHLLSIAIVLD